MSHAWWVSDETRPSDCMSNQHPQKSHKTKNKQTTTRHPTSMGNRLSMSPGARGIAKRREMREKWSQNDVEVAVRSRCRRLFIGPEAPILDTTKRRKYQHGVSGSYISTTRQDTVATALVETSEERWVKLMSTSLYLALPGVFFDDLGVFGDLAA